MLNKIKCYLLLQFKINPTDSLDLSKSLELVYNFAVIATVSLIINGFIINSHRAPYDQMFHMIFASGLLATNWFAQTTFRYRCEKKTIFFRVWTFFKILSLGIMATGIDLMVFRLNGTIETQVFLRWFAPALFLIGFIFSRFLVFLEFLMMWITSKEFQNFKHIVKWKAFSRLLIIILAIVHFSQIWIFKDNANISLLTFAFFPIYLIIESIGNLVGIRTKWFSVIPRIKPAYLKERFSTLTIMYISSFIVSGTIQFAFYFSTEKDFHMLARLFFVYLITFLTWWCYVDRFYRYAMKEDIIYIPYMSILNILICMALGPFGGFLLNANDDLNLRIISVASTMGLSVALIIFNLALKGLMHASDKEELHKALKYKLIVPTFFSIIILLTFAIISIFYVFPVWYLYGVMFIALVPINIHSRILITKFMKNKSRD